MTCVYTAIKDDMMGIGSTAASDGNEDGCSGRLNLPNLLCIGRGSDDATRSSRAQQRLSVDRNTVKVSVPFVVIAFGTTRCFTTQLN